MEDGDPIDRMTPHARKVRHADIPISRFIDQRKPPKADNKRVLARLIKERTDITIDPHSLSMKGDNGSVSGVAARILGSPDIYGHKEREAEQSINFVTCHDGFTPNDLVSYDRKHNAANGEERP